jgi:ribosome-associated protein
MTDLEKKRPAAPTQISVEDLLKLILEGLDEEKASDIVTIDLKGKTNFADFMVIVTSRSQRHASAMADKVFYKLKEKGIYSKVEGEQSSEWFLVDTGAIIVHLFTAEARAYYDLEKIWEVSFKEQL